MTPPGSHEGHDDEERMMSKDEGVNKTLPWIKMDDQSHPFKKSLLTQLDQDLRDGQECPEKDDNDPESSNPSNPRVTGIDVRVCVRLPKPPFCVWSSLYLLSRITTCSESFPPNKR